MEEAMNHLKTALLLAGLISTQAHAAITVRDDDGNAVTLAKPAQRILARLSQHIPAAVQTAIDLPDGERQAFSPMLAILSSQHETQYSRLFRS